MRILSFILLGIVALYAPLWAFLLVACIYSFVYTPYEILIIAVAVDAQFSDMSTFFPYMYTMCVAVLSISVTLIKPKLRMYTQLHDAQDF
jgi:hypothetical protein